MNSTERANYLSFKTGYPNPNRSHFRSTEIWETASDSDTFQREGWLGRYFDNECAGSPEAESVDADPSAIHVGDMIPQTYLSIESHSLFGMNPYGKFDRGQYPDDLAYEKLLQADHIEGNASYLQHTMMNTLVTERRGKNHRQIQTTGATLQLLAQSLKRVAALIHADMETRVYFVSQGGYDTHANQLNNHQRLLTELSTSMSAFQRSHRSQ